MNDTLKPARESFHGKTMTEAQLKETRAIADILHAEIQRSGSFREKLTDYSHAFARSEKFDALRGEAMIRDVYSASYGRSMNQMRESLKDAELRLPEATRGLALEAAERVEHLIQDEPTQPFYQAYDRVAVDFAEAHGITQATAKSLMKESFEARHGTEMYAHMKQVEAEYHMPVRDAEREAHRAKSMAERSQTQSRS